MTSARKLLTLGGAVLVLAAALLSRSVTTAGGAAGPIAHWVFDPDKVRGQEVPDLAGKLPAKLVGAPASLRGAPTVAVHLRKPTERVVIDPRCPGDAPLLVDFHYCYVTLDGGHLEFRVFDHRNTLFDSFDLDKDR